MGSDFGGLTCVCLEDATNFCLVLTTPIKCLDWLFWLEFLFSTSLGALTSHVSRVLLFGVHVCLFLFFLVCYTSSPMIKGHLVSKIFDLMEVTNNFSTCLGTFPKIWVPRFACFEKHIVSDH